LDEATVAIPAHPVDVCICRQRLGDALAIRACADEQRRNGECHAPSVLTLLNSHSGLLGCAGSRTSPVLLDVRTAAVDEAVCTMTSTRELRRRPAALWFPARGRLSPLPTAVRR